jgi:hypothetical protein
MITEAKFPFNAFILAFGYASAPCWIIKMLSRDIQHDAPFRDCEAPICPTICKSSFSTSPNCLPILLYDSARKPGHYNCIFTAYMTSSLRSEDYKPQAGNRCFTMGKIKCENCHGAERCHRTASGRTPGASCGAARVDPGTVNIFTNRPDSIL